MFFVILSAGIFVVTVVLPILSFVRLTVATRRLEDVEGRLRALEARVDLLMRPTRTPAPAPIHPPAASVPPPATAAPVGPPVAPGLESEIGSRLMLLVGTVVLVLGVGFFVKYAFDNSWLSPANRVVGGSIAGIAVWLAGLRFAKHGYPLYGRMIAGGGLAMIYLSAYSACALYALVPAAAAFSWMAATSAITALTADREQSPGMALMAIVLGYASPFLVASGADHHIALFVYDASLVGATFVLARRHEWPLLTLVSFGLNWVSVAAWSADFYRPGMYVSTEIYLTVVSALFLAMLRARHHADDPIGRLTILVLWTGPLAYHVASVAVLFPHAVPFLVYLIAITAAGVAWGTANASPAARLVLWCMVAAPFFSWLPQHAAGSWYSAVLATGGAIYFLHFFGQLHAIDAGTPTSETDTALFHLNGLGLFGFVYLAVHANAGSTAAAAFGLAAWNGLLAQMCRRRQDDVVPHALALCFTFTAIGVSIALTGPWWTAAWAAEGAAVIWIGIVTCRPWLRYGGAMLLAMATGRLIVLEFAETATSFTLLFNRRMATGGFIVAMMYGVAALHRGASAKRRDEHYQWATGWVVAANVLTVALLTSDIYSYWSIREERRSAGFARELTISLTWAAYAMGLVALGFMRQIAALRYLALVLFGVTVAKMFSVDLLELEGVYRISGFTVMGLMLLAASFLYQRYGVASSPVGPT